jgi:glucokinase
MQPASIVGIDVGSTKTAVIVGTLDGLVVTRTERTTQPGRPFAETWPGLRAQIAESIDASRARGQEPAALSIAIGGPLVVSTGHLLDPPNLPGWHGVALQHEVAAAFPGLPVYIEHDAKAGALAEYRFGAGRHRPTLRDMVFLTFGTGLGAGIIAGGRLVRGAAEMAGEVWSLAPRAPAASRVPDVADWESAASGRGLRLLAARMYPARWTTETATRDLVAAALADDVDAMEVVHECGRWLGAGLATIVTILNPQLIVLGTLAVVLGERVLQPARDELARCTVPRARTGVEIVPGGLGRRLGDVQSLMAGIEAFGVTRR